MGESYEKHEIILQIKNVSLSYGEKLILNNVNADVQNIVRPGYNQGQVVALLGPSGIGKTQLFLTCAGLQQPTSGIVCITEKCIPVQRGMVGVVFQNYPLFNHRTVMGNLLIAARQKNGTKEKVRDRVIAILERFKLLDHAHLYPVQLSGGQRQRVAIARQLLCSEHYLLMDEPFSGLDPLMKENVCTLISEIAQMDELNTMIVTTHDIESAVSIADTIWLMGREFDANGKSRGAYIKKMYNLIDLGLTWHKNIAKTAEFSDFVKELKEEFHSL